MPGSKRILIIDNDSLIRFFMERILEMGGYDITSVASGEEAIVRFGERPYDLVLTDLMMQGMDGSEVARFVKAASPNTPVLVVTGFAGTTAAAELQGLGVRVLKKPFEPGELLALASALTQASSTS